MMDVSDTGHGDEGEIMKEPAYDGIETRVVDLVKFCGFERGITTLPTDKVPKKHEAEDAKGGSATPVHSWVAEEEIFDDYGDLLAKSP